MNFKTWEKPTATTEAVHHAKINDTLEVLGNNDSIETYRITKVYRPNTDPNKYCSIEAIIIKKNGETGKKKVVIENAYDKNYYGWTANLKIYTR